MSDWKYFDGSDPPRPLTIGDKVNVWENPDAVGLEPGLIVKFDEPDCDYNDELGRPEMYGPYCVVQWPDTNELDRFTGQPRITWNDYPDGPDTFYFDDLVRLPD
jgi:hypothetical protein